MHNIEMSTVRNFPARPVHVPALPGPARARAAGRLVIFLRRPGPLADSSRLAISRPILENFMSVMCPKYMKTK